MGRGLNTISTRCLPEISGGHFFELKKNLKNKMSYLLWNFFYTVTRYYFKRGIDMKLEVTTSKGNREDLLI